MVPGLFVAQGLLDGGATFPGGEPWTIAALAADNGFGHISVQWDYVPQWRLLDAMREACHDHGLTFGVWEAEPQPGTGAAAVHAAQADHYIAQAETPRDWPTIVRDFRVEYPEPFPAAVVTTFHGIGALPDETYDPETSRPVIDAGFHCLTEAYVGVSANWTPDRLDFTGTKQFGWPRTQPTIGVFGGYTAERYVTEHNLAAYPGYFVWLAETMTERDWAVLREFNART